jgi:hypothetical protein
MSNSTTISPIIKDIDFQRGCSMAVLLGLIFYNTMNSTIEYETIANNYPEYTVDTAIWVQHIWYFITLVLSIYFWTGVYMIIVFVVLSIFKIKVLNVLKFDTGIFNVMQTIISKGLSGNVLGSLSEMYDERSDKEITLNDVQKMMFSFFSYKDGLIFCAKLLFFSVIISIIFGTYIAPPEKMKSKISRETNIRLFFVTYLASTFLMFIIFAISTNLLSIPGQSK